MMSSSENQRKSSSLSSSSSSTGRIKKSKNKFGGDDEEIIKRPKDHIILPSNPIIRSNKRPKEDIISSCDSSEVPRKSNLVVKQTKEDIIITSSCSECSKPISEYEIPGDIPFDIDFYNFDNFLDNFFQAVPDMSSDCETCNPNTTD